MVIDFKEINETLDKTENILKALFRFTAFLIAIGAWMVIVFALVKVAIKIGGI